MEFCLFAFFNIYCHCLHFCSQFFLAAFGCRAIAFLDVSFFFWDFKLHPKLTTVFPIKLGFYSDFGKLSLFINLTKLIIRLVPKQNGLRFAKRKLFDTLPTTNTNDP